MNNHECNDEFHISYNHQEVPVKVICEENDMYFIVELPERRLKVLHDIDEAGQGYWVEEANGETDLATQLGELIEYAPFEQAYTV